MNFGTDGYGTDQIYLQYLKEGVPLGLDYVFYMCFSNDLSDIMVNNLLRLDRDGNIRASQYRERPFINFINKFYLTYFLLEHNANLKKLLECNNKKWHLKIEREKIIREVKYKFVLDDFRNGVIVPEVKEALGIFLAVLLEMRRACNQNCVKFYIATIPLSCE